MYLPTLPTGKLIPALVDYDTPLLDLPFLPLGIF